MDDSSIRALSGTAVLRARCPAAEWRQVLVMAEGPTTDRVLPSPRMRCWPVAGHSALMSALRSPHHVPKRWVILLVIGVALALLGLLWFLQGVGAVHVRPILCVSNCKPVEKSVGWLIAGVAACMAGITITTMSARHLHHR